MANIVSDTVNLATGAAADGVARGVKPPGRERIVGGYWPGVRGAGAGVLLGRTADEVVRKFGLHVYELMLYDPAVAAAFALLKAGIIADGLTPTPAEVSQPGEVASRRKRKGDVQLSQEIVEALCYSLEGLEEPVDQTAEELLDCVPFGCALSEVTYQWEDDGPYRGKLVHKSIVPKPRWSWAFLVDAFLGVDAIRGWTGAGWGDFDPEDFAWCSWKPKDRDPRGRSGFRAAYNPWNFKMQEYPELAEYLHHFAQPSVIATAGQNAQNRYVLDANTGLQVELSVLEEMAAQLEEYKSRAYLALPYGATASLVESHGEGDAFHNAFDRWDMEIFRAILFSARPMQESKSGGDGAGNTALGMVDMSFRAGRRPLARMFERHVFYPFVKLNWGRDVARRLTPKATFAGQNAVGAQLLTAMSSAYNAGFIDEAQLPRLWHSLGLPPIDDDALKARIERKDAVLDKAQGALPNATGKVSKTGPADPGKGGGVGGRATDPANRAAGRGDSNKKPGGSKPRTLVLTNPVDRLGAR